MAKIDPLTGTVIKEPPAPVVRSDEEIAELNARIAADSELAELRRVDALRDQATEVFRTYVDVARAALARAGEDLEADLSDQVFPTASAALAIWLANTV